MIALVPALGLTVYTGLQLHERSADAARANARRLVRIASANQNQILDGARVLLIALARLPEVRRRDAAACSALVADLREQYPLFANIGAIKPDGDLFCSAVPFAGNVSVADRTYFRAAIIRRTFAIGDYQVGRVTGRRTLNAAYPVLDAAGALQAVVFVAIDLDWLQRLAASAGLPPGSSVTVIDGNGTVLVHDPDGHRWIGRSVRDTEIGRMVLAAPEEGTAEALGFDGLRRLFAYAALGVPSPEGRARVVVGIPAAVAFAESNRLMARQLAGLLAVAAVVLGIAWLVSDATVLRSVRALVRGRGPAAGRRPERAQRPPRGARRAGAAWRRIRPDGRRAAVPRGASRSAPPDRPGDPDRAGPGGGRGRGPEPAPTADPVPAGERQRL